jgi:hypothetical protein
MYMQLELGSEGVFGGPISSIRIRFGFAMLCDDVILLRFLDMGSLEICNPAAYSSWAFRRIRATSLSIYSSMLANSISVVGGGSDIVADADEIFAKLHTLVHAIALPFIILLLLQAVLWYEDQPASCLLERYV